MTTVIAAPDRRMPLRTLWFGEVLGITISLGFFVAEAASGSVGVEEAVTCLFVSQAFALFVVILWVPYWSFRPLRTRYLLTESAIECWVGKRLTSSVLLTEIRLETEEVRPVVIGSEVDWFSVMFSYPWSTFPRLLLHTVAGEHVFARVAIWGNWPGWELQRQVRDAAAIAQGLDPSLVAVTPLPPSVPFRANVLPEEGVEWWAPRMGPKPWKMVLGFLAASQLVASVVVVAALVLWFLGSLRAASHGEHVYAARSVLPAMSAIPIVMLLLALVWSARWLWGPQRTRYLLTPEGISWVRGKRTGQVDLRPSSDRLIVVPEFTFSALVWYFIWPEFSRMVVYGARTGVALPCVNMWGSKMADEAHARLAALMEAPPDAS